MENVRKCLEAQDAQLVVVVLEYPQKNVDNSTDTACFYLLLVCLARTF